MKSRLTLAAGITAVLAASAQAEVKINDNLALDGYAIGSGVVTEGTAAKNDTLGDNAFWYDSVYVGLTGKYGDFSGKVSLYAINSAANGTSADAGLLDAYITYTMGSVAITGGKYLGYLGFESFHSPNNAFISFSQDTYSSPWSTGLKVDYTGDGFATGISVRDSQNGPGGSFFEGDGEYSDDIGYEAFFSYTGIEKLTLFAGAGFEDVDGGSSVATYDFWASYQLTDALSVAGEYSLLEGATNYSWLLQTTYAITGDLSVSGRITGKDTDVNDTFGYGIASTYTITENFSVKGEVTKLEDNTAGDTFSYAIQGLFRF